MMYYERNILKAHSDTTVYLSSRHIDSPPLWVFILSASIASAVDSTPTDQCVKRAERLWKRHTNQSIPWRERRGFAALQEYDAILKLYSESINQRSSIQPGGFWWKKEHRQTLSVPYIYLYIPIVIGVRCYMHHVVFHTWTFIDFFRSWLKKQTIFNVF